MKREAVAHTKMKRLCRRLDIPLWQGVGLLESIWHLTARETPRGDIGKLRDEDVALGIDFRGNEAKLIEALVASGWLDRDPVERLAVHDWYEHADDAVDMRVARARQHFIGCMIHRWLENETIAPKVANLAALAAQVWNGPALPDGCELCGGGPLVVREYPGGYTGGARCTCPRGQALLQLDQCRVERPQREQLRPVIRRSPLPDTQH